MTVPVGFPSVQTNDPLDPVTKMTLHAVMPPLGKHNVHDGGHPLQKASQPEQPGPSAGGRTVDGWQPLQRVKVNGFAALRSTDTPNTTDVPGLNVA